MTILFVLLIFCLASVSAAETDQISDTESHSLSRDSLEADEYTTLPATTSQPTDIQTNFSHTTVPNVNIQEPVEKISSVQELKIEEGQTLSFKDLQNEIDNAGPGSILNLHNDYTYDKNRDGDSLENEGIILNKNLEINGNGHTLNGDMKSRILQSKEGTVTLKNIIFREGQIYDPGAFDSTEYGGAIRIKGDAKYTIINCTFIDNCIHGWGAGISNEGKELTVKDCIFKNNSQKHACALDPSYFGGAIYSSKHLYVENCIFRDNYCRDHGGAIYAKDGLELAGQNIFENNEAKYAGGAIYTNKFTGDVKNTIFKDNKAGSLPLTTDDGGAIYINKANEVTFSDCAFINNYCTDEGGAIYLDSTGSKLSLINNIFIGNRAGDEGQTVFNKGKYTTVKNNWWGDDMILFDDVLIEWHSGKSNEHHYDEAPLKLRLTIGATQVNSNTPIFVEAKFITTDNSPFNGNLCGLERMNMKSDKKGTIKINQIGSASIEYIFTPQEEGKHKIQLADFCNSGTEISGYLNVDNSAFPDGTMQVTENKLLSLRDLQNMIDNAAEGSTLNLEKDFIYCHGDNTLNDKAGIKINKNIIINGHGHTIDAKSSSGIFQSEKGTIRLENLILKNGYQKAADDGGALRLLDEAECKIYNCIFDSNKAHQDGGAIFNTGKYIYIQGSTFTNNRAEGANGLNDCDGGAIHTKQEVKICNCTFKNNYAADSGGAIYATDGMSIVGNPSHFEGNTAYKGKGGAIYTIYFYRDVYYATFKENKAGEGATVSDDGGAIYINDINNITFKSCAFINNYCTDEGGAIFLHATNSYLELINNIFIGNKAKDEGQTVFNKGTYGTVKNNFWGDDTPSNENDQLIEWKAVSSNDHKTDEDPLTLKFEMSRTDCLTLESLTGTVRFTTSNGQTFNGKLPKNTIRFTNNGNLKTWTNRSVLNTVVCEFDPAKAGNFKITANLYGYTISKTVNIYDIKIIADEITSPVNVSKTLKIHLEGDKKYTANQKVHVHFLKDQIIYTDENGDATITIDPEDHGAGKYAIRISALGYTTQTAINLINPPEVTNTITAKEVVQVKGDVVKFEAQFRDINGTCLEKGTKVEFTIDGNKTYESYIDDDNGHAQVEFTSLTRGEHKIIVKNLITGETKQYRAVILAGC